MSHADTKTWAEIMAQPAIWRSWGKELSAHVGDVRAWIARSGAEEIWLSGAGSSAFIGDLVSAALDGHLSVPVRSMPSTDLVAQPRRVMGRKPLVVSFGRSGNSAESVGVMDALDALAPDAARLNITCNAGSALARRAGPNGRVVTLPCATHDAGFAMTSSYSTMLLTALAILDPETPETVSRIGGLADSAADLLPRLTQHALSAPVPKRIVFVGSGALQFAAREAALKVMELTGGEVAALWDSTLGFRHGPKSFVLPDTDLVLLKSGDPFTRQYDDDLDAELGQQFPDARRVSIGPGCDLDTAQQPDAWGAVLPVLYAQVQGVVWSDKLGFQPDNPFEGRGTLTRVVSGVTLYDPAVA